jgi:hypothetical protein
MTGYVNYEEAGLFVEMPGSVASLTRNSSRFPTIYPQICPWELRMPPTYGSLMQWPRTTLNSFLPATRTVDNFVSQGTGRSSPTVILTPSRRVGFRAIAVPHYTFPQGWVALDTAHFGLPAHPRRP